MKYSMIVDYIKKEISDGRISSGGKIPSIRELCCKFNCTKSTAVRAYYELKEQGLVYAVPGSGYYLIDNFSAQNRCSKTIDLSGTSLDMNSLPYSEFQPCVNQAMVKYKEKLFSYSDPQGLPSLIEATRKHLRDHQVFANSDRVFVTTGSQQVLDILSKMTFPNGKSNAVIEQPTYQGIIKGLEHNGIRAIGVSRSFNSLDFEGLERSFRNDNVKFFYTITRFSNPLGLSYTNDEKKRILALAEKYNVYIIEDDYIGDLDSEAKSTPIFSFDKSDRVIYIKTFSKVLLPGLRVAVTVLPQILVNRFRDYKYWSDLNTPMLSQGALEIYMSSGLFNVHVSKVRDLYSRRMTCLRDAIAKKSSAAIGWHVPIKEGFYAGMEILNGSRAKTVIEGLRKKDILLSNIENNYLKEFYNDKVLRISVAKVETDELIASIPLLINEIENGTIKYKSSIDL